MPAYNAEKYISQAINSIIAQTFNEWELVIADDCSTDNTVGIIEGYIREHKNIRLIRRCFNSGGARLPRMEAALATRTELIMTYDADDFLDTDYIEKMYNRKIKTDSNIVLSTLYLCNSDGQSIGKYIPNNDFNLDSTMSGKEATKYLLGEVAISVNGLLIDRGIYINNITTSNPEQNSFAYVDEIDQRRLLFCCDKVAFANTKYHYRQHSESLMHLKDIKRYNFLTTNTAIYEFAKKNYTDCGVFRKLQRDYILNLMYCQRDFYFYNHHKAEFAKEATKIIKDAFEYAKKEKMQAQGRKQRISMLSYITFKGISHIYAILLKIKKQIKNESTTTNQP